MCAFSQLLHPVSTRNFETAPSVTVTSRVYWRGGGFLICFILMTDKDFLPFVQNL